MVAAGFAALGVVDAGRGSEQFIVDHRHLGQTDDLPGVGQGGCRSGARGTTRGVADPSLEWESAVLMMFMGRSS